MIEGAITKKGAKGLGAEIPGKVYFGVQGPPGPPLNYDDLTPEQKEELNGKDGGYYTPSVSQPDQETVQFDFTPSKADMPAVAPATVRMPKPDSGGNVDVTIDGETLVIAENSTATIENETLIL